MSDEVKPLEPLKACPICNNNAFVQPSGLSSYRVSCIANCVATRFGPTESEARELWNRRPEDEADDYVAYLCSRKVHRSGGFYGSSLKVCDSDADGAFKVYRRPADTKVKEWAERLLLACEYLNPRRTEDIVRAIAEEMKNAGNS